MVNPIQNGVFENSGVGFPTHLADSNGPTLLPQAPAQPAVQREPVDSDVGETSFSSQAPTRAPAL